MHYYTFQSPARIPETVSAVLSKRQGMECKKKMNNKVIFLLDSLELKMWLANKKIQIII